MLKKIDVFILSILFILGLLLTGLIYFPKSSVGSHVVIRENGIVRQMLPLTSNTCVTIPCDNGGINTIQVKDGAVSMIEANCADHICINHAPIHSSNESIICLPHRLTVEISNNEVPGPDAVSY